MDRSRYFEAEAIESLLRNAYLVDSLRHTRQAVPDQVCNDRVDPETKKNLEST